MRILLRALAAVTVMLLLLSCCCLGGLKGEYDDDIDQGPMSPPHSEGGGGDV